MKFNIATIALFLGLTCASQDPIRPGYQYLTGSKGQRVIHINT